MLSDKIAKTKNMEVSSSKAGPLLIPSEKPNEWSHKMGQEKSLPDRCNSSQDYHSTATSIQRPPSRAPSTATTKSSRSTYSTAEKQAKYLKEQLYIKSYLDIVEQDQTAKTHFQPAKPGIRNYTPKIYVDKPRQKDVDVWI